MRGFTFLVVFGLGCSSTVGAPEPLPLELSGSAGAAVSIAGASATSGGPSMAGSNVGGAAGEQAQAGAATGGVSGSAGSAQAGSAGQAEVGGGGASSVGGSSAGSVAAGGSAQAGAATTNQCAGFTEYTVPVGTCIAVTGGYQVQGDPVSCSPDMVTTRDHCFTCQSWTASAKPLKILLALDVSASVDRYDATGNDCPSGCKYICH